MTSPLLQLAQSRSSVRGVTSEKLYVWREVVERVTSYRLDSEEREALHRLSAELLEAYLDAVHQETR